VPEYEPWTPDETGVNRILIDMPVLGLSSRFGENGYGGRNFGKFLKANGFGTGTAPSVAHHNSLYVGSDDGSLYAIGR
jgi:hypothetical protein